MLPIDTNTKRPTDCFRVYAIAFRASIEPTPDTDRLKKFGYLEVGDLVAVIGADSEETGDCDLTADGLTAFSDRLSELHRAFDILPFRFTRAATVSDIGLLLREHSDAYRQNLKHISGCTEVNARWASEDNLQFVASSQTEAAQISSLSGGNYLRAKHHTAILERESAIELTSIATMISQRAGIPCIDTRSSMRRIRSAEQNSMLVFGLEVLIKRKDAEQYLQALSETRFRNKLPTIATGPWPPFSFIKELNSTIVKAPFCGSATAELVQKRAIFCGTEAAS